MFFILSKTIGFFLLPSNVLIVAGLVGLALMTTRWRRAGTHIAVASLAVLVTLAVMPAGKLLANMLENRFPSWDAARGVPAGIVILGGAINPDLSADRGQVNLSGSAERIIAIAKLARQFPQARIIYSGGNGSLFPKGGAEAEFIYPLLDDFGVPRSRVTLETRSRNTAENAIFSKDIAQPKPGERWLLVTSAMHMPRAVGCFRRAGFPVEAYPVDWTTRTRPKLNPSLSPVASLAGFDEAAHEWEGLFVYWLTGRTSTFLPAP